MDSSALQQTGLLSPPTIDPRQHVILVVDSDRASASRLRSELEEASYPVHIAHSGREAWERIRQLRPSLLILHPSLPDMEGLTLCQQIKQDESLGFLPVIVVSADADADKRLQSARSGADDHLVRPVERHLLLARMQTLLGLRQRFDNLLEAHQELAQELSERERQQRESTQKLTRDVDMTKSTIVRNVSHELRTPLLQVKSAIALLDEEVRANNPNGKSFLIRLLSMAIQATARLESTVSNITQFAESQNMRMEHVILDESVDLAIRNLERSWKYRDDIQRIKKSYGPDIPLVLGDKRGIAQVLQHLLDNALKFSPAGGPVEVLIKPRDDNRVWIGVRDHGIGIPQDELAHIFESFYQVDASSTRRFSGVGIGLTLANLILSRMGSGIEVESQPGKGSTFSFVLPQAQLD